MIKKRTTREQTRFGQGVAAPAVNTAAFAVGALGGFLLCGWLLNRGYLVAELLLKGYPLALDARVGTVSFWESLWDVGRWPLLIWLLGSTALGRWMVPLVFAVRGFFLSYAVAGLSMAAQGGVLLAFCLFGLGSLISLPLFFLLGSQSWEMAGRIRGQLFATLSDYPREYWLRSLIVLAGVFLCAMVEYQLLPVLLRRITPLLG